VIVIIFPKNMSYILLLFSFHYTSVVTVRYNQKNSKTLREYSPSQRYVRRTLHNLRDLKHVISL
jgi:uncharacterized membrane protein